MASRALSRTVEVFPAFFCIARLEIGNIDRTSSSAQRVCFGFLILNESDDRSNIRCVEIESRHSLLGAASAYDGRNLVATQIRSNQLGACEVGAGFATGRVAVSPSDEALHEEARRLARLLVSEIKLYHEEQVEEGRRKRDVYERLKEDIDRSRQMYEERVEPRILKTTDYFYQELVRILAAGDAKALGI